MNWHCYDCQQFSSTEYNAFGKKSSSNCQGMKDEVNNGGGIDHMLWITTCICFDSELYAKTVPAHLASSVTTGVLGQRSQHILVIALC